MSRSGQATISSVSLRVLLPVLAAAIALFALAAWWLPGELSRRAITQAQESATASAEQLRGLRGYYTEQVVASVLADVDTAVISHYEAIAHAAIPLPATLLRELGAPGTFEDGTVYDLHSAFPYPNRAPDPRDKFGREAWNFLTANPAGSFSRAERRGEGQVVRAAVADTMTHQICVDCHNAHPLSPRTDWQLGDVRGVVEVRRPIDAALAAARSTANAVLGGVAGGLLLLLAALGLMLRSEVTKPLARIDGGLERIVAGEIDAPPAGLTRLGRERTEAGRLARRAMAVIARLREFRSVLELTRRDQFEKFSWFDSVTGLPSRGQFEHQLAQAAGLAGRHGHPMALLLIHVAGIDATEAQYGPEVADALRRELADRIGQCLRASDDLSRITMFDEDHALAGGAGGDEETERGEEFAVVLREAAAPADVAAVAERLLAALGTPVNLGGRTISCVSSIGISRCPVDGGDTGTLLRVADTALRAARRAGGRCYRPPLEAMQPPKSKSSKAGESTSENAPRRKRRRGKRGGRRRK